MGCGCAGTLHAGCGTPPYAVSDALTSVESDAARTQTHIPYCGTLARELITVADSIRNLYTTFGLRPYKVSIIRTKWSTGKRNYGVQVPEAPIILVPTPLISDLTAVATITTPGGMDEFGGIMISEISGAYTEDMLRGADVNGESIPADENFYYEVEFPPACLGKPGERRRFFPTGAMFFPDKFQWVVKLERQRMDRARNGDPR